jgi:hypothetical protein
MNDDDEQELAQGPTLAPTQAALVFDPEDGWSFFMPDYGGRQPPREILLMGAILSRLEDEAWVGEMVESFRSQHGG